MGKIGLEANEAMGNAVKNAGDGVSAKEAKSIAKQASKSAAKSGVTGSATSVAKSGIKKFGADDLMELGGQLQQLGAMLPQKQNNSATGVNNRGFSGSISRRRKIA